MLLLFVDFHGLMYRFVQLQVSVDLGSAILTFFMFELFKIALFSIGCCNYPYISCSTFEFSILEALVRLYIQFRSLISDLGYLPFFFGTLFIFSLVLIFELI